MPPVTPYSFHRTLSQADLGDEPTSRASDWIRHNDLGKEIDVTGPTRPITVSNQVLENLRVATKVNRQVKRLLPFGAPNMMIDIVGTHAENWVRMKSRGSRFQLPGLVAVNHKKEAEKILRSGTGNCAEHADIAFHLLATEDLAQPILQVQAAKADHTFVVIGDPVQGLAQCVVVDPWPIVPIAHTLDRCQFKLGRITREHQPGTPVEALDSARTTLMTPHEVNNYSRKRDYPTTPTALLDRALNHDPLQRVHYWQATSTATPNTTYVNIDNSDRFDADTIVNEYADLKARFKRGFLK